MSFVLYEDDVDINISLVKSIEILEKYISLNDFKENEFTLTSHPEFEVEI